MEAWPIIYDKYGTVEGEINQSWDDTAIIVASSDLLAPVIVDVETCKGGDPVIAFGEVSEVHRNS